MARTGFGARHMAAAILLAGVVPAGLWAADPATSGAAPAATQPTTIPGKWELGDAALPDLAATLKAAKHADRLYGLYTWAGEYNTHRESIRKVGFNTVRMGGPFDDAIMRTLVEDNMDPMVTLGRAKGMKAKAGVSAEEDAAFLKEFADHVETFTKRYGPGGTFLKENPTLPQRPLKNVEIWNEPNFQYMIAPDGRPTKDLEAAREALYAKVLPAAYAAAKKGSPEINVVGFAAGGSGAGDMRFVEHVLAANPEAARAFDTFSTHPYVDPAPPEAYSVRSWGKYSAAASLRTIRGTLEKYKRGDVPVWYTEIGWPISKADGGRYETKGPNVTPDLQAAYICRLYAYSLRLGVTRTYIMFATDTDNYNGGFFLPDKSWRKSAAAVQTMIALLPAPKLIGAPADGEGGTFVFRFSPAPDARHTVLMAWNVAGPKTVEIPVEGAAVTVTDAYGKARPATPAAGKLSVEIGPMPVYIRAE